MQNIIRFIKGKGGKVLLWMINIFLLYQCYLGWQELITVGVEYDYQPLEIFHISTLYVAIPLMIMMLIMIIAIRIKDGKKKITLKQGTRIALGTVAGPYFVIGLMLMTFETNSIQGMILIWVVVYLIRVMPEGTFKLLREVAILEYKTLTQKKPLQEEQD